MTYPSSTSSSPSGLHQWSPGLPSSLLSNSQPVLSSEQGSMSAGWGGGGGVSSWTRGFSRARVQQDGGVSLQRDWTYAASSLPSVGNRTPAWQSRKCAQSWNPGLFWKKSFLNTYSCQMAMMAALSLTWLPRNRLRALKQIPFLNNVSLAKFTHQKSKSR